MLYKEVRTTFSSPEEQDPKEISEEVGEIFDEMHQEFDQFLHTVEDHLQGSYVTAETSKELQVLIHHGHEKEAWKLAGDKLMLGSSDNDLLNLLASKGYSKDIFEKGKKNKIDWLHSTNSRVTETLIQNGEGKEIFSEIENKVDTSKSIHCGVLQKLAEHGFAPKIMERFGATLELNSGSIGLLSELCKAGFVDVIFEKIKDKLDMQFCRTTLFFTLINLGKGNELLEQVQKQIRLDQAPHVRFLKHLAEKGQTQKIKELFGKDLDPNDREHAKLLESIEREGKEEVQNFEKVENPPQEYSEDEQNLIQTRFSLIKEEIVEKMFEDTFPEIPKLEPLREQLKKLFSKLAYQELRFLKLGIEKYGSILHPKVQYAIKHFLGGDRIILEMAKTASELYIFIDPKKGVSFVNDIQAENAQTWRLVHDAGIPVAPIVEKETQRKSGKTRVYSRYCGLSVAEIEAALGVEPYQDHPDKNLDAFHKYLLTKSQEIREQLENVRGADQNDTTQKVTHGHPHFGNMTVEFIRREYYDKHMESDGNINQIPFQEEQFTFDLSNYLSRPEEYTPVVRLIDWDASQSLPQAA